jgi:hypothetical protein
MEGSHVKLHENVNIIFYKTAVLLLYGCESWFVTLKEELGVFESRVLRRIFSVKKGEQTGGLCRLQNETFIMCSFHQG